MLERNIRIQKMENILLNYHKRYVKLMTIFLFWHNLLFIYFKLVQQVIIMVIKNILQHTIIIFLIYVFSRYIFFDEPIFLYLFYIFFFNNRKLIFFISCIIFLNINIFIFLKNIIFFLLFEIILIILTNDRIKTKGKYRTFLLTFLLYLVLINVFEPIVYSYIRLFRSICLYVINLFVYKIYIVLIRNKRKRLSWMMYLNF